MSFYGFQNAPPEFALFPEDVPGQPTPTLSLKPWGMWKLISYGEYGTH